MTQKHDFEAALTDLAENVFNGKDHEEYAKAYWLDDHWDAVVLALKLAQKVTGEPSEEMLYEAAYLECDENKFVEMVNQAIKEIESE